MARLRSADGDRYTPHCVNVARHTRLVKDNILNRLRLFLRNILRRDDRRGLRLILRLFLRCIRLYTNLIRGVVTPRSEPSFANVVDTDAIT